jgi:hypothetical protein
MRSIFLKRCRYRDVPQWMMDSQEKAFLKRLLNFRSVILAEIERRVAQFENLEASGHDDFLQATIRAHQKDSKVLSREDIY